MLKNAKQSGKGRERDVAQVGVDMTPPEISYEIVKTATGRNTGELKIIVTDNQSGIDPTATVVMNASNTIQPGVPVIQQVLTDKEKVEPKRQVRFYQLLFPDFVPTETQASGGDFRVAAEGEAPAESGSRNFGFGNSGDKSGIPAPFQLALGLSNPYDNLLGSQECQSSGSNFKLAGLFDLDHDGPDLTLIVFPNQAIFIDPFRDIRGVTAQIGGRQTSSLVQNIPIWNASQILDSSGKSTGYGKKAQDLYTEGMGKNNQSLINQGIDLLMKKDALDFSFIQLGTSQKEVTSNLEIYKRTSTHLYEMILNGLKGKVAPASLYPGQIKKGFTYDFSVDLDQVGFNNVYNNLRIGESTLITLNVKGELIKFNLTKQVKTGRTANWSVRCVS